ncbi:McrC family protein [Aliarcobacter cryaerophilus]|uniref:McrC family protein n=1 Tax=Aliarcobacter cryaerophilus TaxID=28198 RepID=UPI003DA3D60E
MKKEFILKEFEYLQYKDNTKDNFIKKETFVSLEKFVLENEETAQYLKITTKKGFGKVLQAQNYVGVIQTKDGTTIEILPKIKNATIEKSKEILIKMLKTLKNSPFKNSSVANLKSSKIPLFEIFISMFLEELAKLVQKGIKSDYIKKEENLKFLKGKLKISEQIKYNTIHKERFFVAYEEFLSDRVENRLIKTTLQFLYNKSKLNKNQQRIREFLFVFDEIEISHNIKTDFSKIKLNRQMKDYEQVLLWCKTFLFENSFSPYKGNDIAFALLFDMNLLFESFVYSYLKKSSNFQDIKSQDRTHYLAYENGIGRFRLKPDIVINGGKIIADTKWKILSEDKAYNGVLQDDMYQLYAYGTKYANCEKIYLIYPFDELIIKNSYNYFKNKELKLDILFFDVYKKEFVDKNIEL